MSSPCRCEHVSHFEGEGHEYGHDCGAELVTVVTDFGAFEVCPPCAEEHLRPFAIAVLDQEGADL